MCIIIDNCMRDDFFGSSPSKASIVVRNWIRESTGRVVYGGKLAAELNGSESAKRTLAEWSRAGRARLIPRSVVDIEQAKLDSLKLCASNDSHVIALARVSGARVLFSSDADLHSDFKSPQLIDNPRGSVYQNESHAHLLVHTRSCAS